MSHFVSSFEGVNCDVGPAPDTGLTNPPDLPRWSLAYLAGDRRGFLSFMALMLGVPYRTK